LEAIFLIALKYNFALL